MYQSEVISYQDQEQLEIMRVQIGAAILDSAEVRDPKTGYIFCKKVNQLVDPYLLWGAAAVIKGRFLDTLPASFRPNKVVGIANKGKELATVLGLALGLPIVITERVVQSDSGGPDAWYDGVNQRVVINGVSSFTKGRQYEHHLNQLEPDDQVIVADDFCAYGHKRRSGHWYYRR